MDDLSVCASICRCVRRCISLSSSLWKNSGSDPDVVWHHRSDGSRDEAGSRVGDRSTGMGTFGANLGHTIVTIGDFMAYVCDGAAMRPSSQITLGKLVIHLFCFILLSSSVTTLLASYITWKFER